MEAMEDQDVLFAARPATSEQRDRAERKGWPDGLLERMLALRWPAWKVELYLSADGFPTVEMLDGEVRDRERLSTGLCVREATWEDDERLSDLFANSTERLGDWNVVVERSPNPYAQQRLQENWHVKVLDDRGVALAANMQAGRSSYVNGQAVSVSWMGGWRVRNEFRRTGLSGLLMSTPGPASGVFGMVSYWYVRTTNGLAQSWIAQQVTELQASSGRPVDKLTASVHHVSAAGGGRRDARVRPIRADDLPRCVELINTTHAGLDLFRRYSVDFLRGRLDDLFWGPKPPFVPRVYGWDEMAVLEDEGEIVACGGLWDRGRDTRERWTHRDTGDEHVIDVTCLMDVGHAPGRADALAALIGHHLASTSTLGRTSMVAALEFLPDVVELLDWASPEAEVRVLETMGFRSPEVQIDATMTRPYTDLAYW